LCFAALGSDTGGSIRFPSTMCGLSGLKPSWGRVSRAGVFPLAPSLDHIGPMTRSALDAALVLGVLAGLDPDDPTTSPAPVPDYAATIDRGVRGLRIGVPTNVVGMDADSRSALDGAIAALAAAGGSMVEIVLPPLDEPTVQWLSLCGVEAALAHEKTYPARAAEYGPVLAGLLEAGCQVSTLDLARLRVSDRRPRFRRSHHPRCWPRLSKRDRLASQTATGLGTLGKCMDHESPLRYGGLVSAK
jgi:amidase